MLRIRRKSQPTPSPSPSVRPAGWPSRWIWLGWVAMALSGVASRAQDAPALKQLGDAGAKHVEALETTIEQLRREGKFTEALGPAREVLKVCGASLGPDHWRTADARRAIATLEAIAALPEEGRKAMASIGPMNDQVKDLYARGRYAEGVDIARRCFAIRRALAGPGPPRHRRQPRRSGDAAPVPGQAGGGCATDRRALAVQERALGPDHPDTAASLNDLALLLHYQGKLAEAELMHRRASLRGSECWARTTPTQPRASTTWRCC